MNAFGHLEKGKTLLEEDQFEQAIEELLQAKDILEPEYIYMMKALGDAYLQLASQEMEKKFGCS